MTKYYSPTTGGFYTVDVHGPVEKMPGDVTDITDEEWQALLAAQASGLSIVPGTHGKPVAVARIRTAEALDRDLRAERARALTETDALIARHRDELDMSLGTTLTREQYGGLMMWRQLLRDLPKHPQWPNISLPERPT